METWKITRKMNRTYVYIAFALIMVIMSWESNLASASLMNGAIPEESIRIRILANSDRAQDQWIKKEIRDAITANVNTWSLTNERIEDARIEVISHLQELSDIVGALLVKYNFTYGYKVELGEVYFPAKIVGGTTYPAGDYEALRVTLGDGEGQNWWCVLFPPLCFGSAIKATAVDGINVDASVKSIDKLVGADKVAKGKQIVDRGVGDGDAAGEGEDGKSEGKGNGGDGKSESRGKGGAGESEGKVKGNGKSTAISVYEAPVQDGDDVKVKFFVWEKAKKVGGFIKGLFS